MSQPSKRLIHVEWVSYGELASSDVATPVGAFLLANDLLFAEKATDQVKVWLAGDRNVPTVLTQANIRTVAQAYTERSS